ncbi:hypothetical protein [Bradyrhizobium sp. Ai1a-2]|uniref:hypothetical protein n=1 Tax=Bradyrhizobium sp. Ai1a-2 TaxID=196490 RepID=UPI0003FD8BAB|nr:hypothetical protein [Bradyrhizobium sp. Ai1a-2]
MTAISAASGSTYQSPLQRLQDELQSEINSGAVSSSDQDALSSALTDIDASMQAGRASDQPSGTRPSPDEMKSKLDDLISQEVSSGKLTSDQATELQGVFKAAFAQGPGGAHGHHGDAGGPPPSDAVSSADDSSTATNSVSDILQQFLQSLQDSLSTSASSSYNSAGSASASANGSSFSALLIDYQS